MGKKREILNGLLMIVRAKALGAQSGIPWRYQGVEIDWGVGHHCSLLSKGYL